MILERNETGDLYKHQIWNGMTYVACCLVIERVDSLEKEIVMDM